MGVLDGGVRVSLITKKHWEKMGKPHLEASDIVAKMADGTIAKPIGMLQDLRIKILKHRVKNTFMMGISPNNLTLMR